MRLYPADSEEALRARKLLKEWAGEGLLTSDQYQRLQQESVSDLRTTNIFLRLVLFLFTLFCVGAAAALFFEVFLSRPSQQAFGIFYLIFAAVCYAAAEYAAAKARLYRYGIEEALAVCSVGFLCAGMQAVMKSAKSMIPAAGAILSLWIWRRFGLWYALLASMILAIFLPGYWTSSRASQHGIVAAIYVAGLIGIIAIRTRHHYDYLEANYSLAEALLWLGLYLALNLHLSSFHLQPNSEYPRPFYWTTWVLIWILPPLVLARGIHQRDRFVLSVGGLAAILTFVTNKPYLGWPRHTWDPMLLGLLLTGIALYLRRWLATGPDGIRHGFTAARLSANNKQWLTAGPALLGLVTPQSIIPGTQPNNPDFHFDGGSSGGGGVTGNF